MDPADSDYAQKRIAAIQSRLPYRIKGKSWWQQELPTESEMQEGLENLKREQYKVDYVITHCASTRIQHELEWNYGGGSIGKLYEEDCLTDYFEQLEDMLEYKKWYCGHYHVNRIMDQKHIVLFEEVIPLEW